MFWNVFGTLVILVLLNALFILNASEGWEDEWGFHQIIRPKPGDIPTH